MRRRAFDQVDPYLAPAWRDEPQPPEDEMTDMNTAHRRDYEAKRLMEDVADAIQKLMSSDAAIGRLMLSDRDAMNQLRTNLSSRCAQIVSAWD